MKNRKLSQMGWAMAIVFGMATLVIACTNDSDELESCGCTYYPEINQWLPDPLDADDVKGEDTYYSGERLRSLNSDCLDRCE
ncbi:hypothetical protein [Robertkochia sediminum]|uniref:hypothetical protein n=1 Tax=Robertkochia sediminum TaxID=2785326 RepID=UPI0019329129|nr:hypothetical protein [Robertkochia sediminum]MBL7471425.1 hypothetical protein [Robertkochia sediminum]